MEKIFKPAGKKIKHIIPKLLRQLDEIIEDNVFNSIINEQLKSAAAQFFPVRIIIEKPSLSVIIQKKKTHMKLAQYLHAACFSPVESTFVKGI